MPNAIPMQLMVAGDETSAELHILGDIYSGFWKGETDTDSSDVAKALADLPETCGEITVHINSMGGEVAQGVAIYNALRASKAHVTTVCEGFACSIASVIFMAGDRRVMRDASLLMVHNAWMSACGNSEDLRKAADDLDTITELSKRAYLSHATEKLDRETLDMLMDEETWILPEQAVEYGFATDVDTDDDDDDEPEQSAMRALMRRVTEPRMAECVSEVTLELTDSDVDRIAQAIAKAMAPQPEPEPEQATDPEPQHKSFMQRAALMFASDAR